MNAYTFTLVNNLLIGVMWLIALVLVIWAVLRVISLASGKSQSQAYLRVLRDQLNIGCPGSMSDYEFEELKHRLNGIVSDHLFHSSDKDAPKPEVALLEDRY